MPNRDPRSTTQRGLGWSHQRERKAAMAVFADGSPCPFCGRPMFRWQRLHWDHSVPRVVGGNGPRRWAHGKCNEQAGARLGHRRGGRGTRQRVPPPSYDVGTASRDW